MDRWCVVSTVGTSLISNLAREQSRDLNELLRNIANEPEQALDADTKRSVSLLADRVLDTVDTADTSRLRRMSAELNGLVSLYGERLFQPERRALDMHYLIATDTYLGMMSADLLALILEQLGFNTVIKPQSAGLTTKVTGPSLTGSPGWWNGVTGNCPAPEPQLPHHLQLGGKLQEPAGIYEHARHVLRR